MALPLLLGLGAGLLGGGQYLLHKMDQRASRSMLDNFREQMGNTQFGQQYGEQYAALAEGLANSGNLLNRTSGQVGSMLQDFIQTGVMYDQRASQHQQHLAMRQAEMAQRIYQDERNHALSREKFDWQREQDRANALAAQGQAGMATALNVSEQLHDNYRQDFGGFSEFQQGAKALRESIFQAGTNAQAAQAAIVGFAKLLDPESVVRTEEGEQIRRAGGWSTVAANALEELKSGGLSERTRNELLAASQSQYNPRAESALSRLGALERKIGTYHDAGVGVYSPVGSQGIDWDWQFGAGMPPAQQQQQTNEMVTPEGFSVWQPSRQTTPGNSASRRRRR